MPVVANLENIILELADSIQDRLHTNGLYIDQVAAAAPYPCYASNHNHPKGGGEFWYNSYRDMMAELRESHLRKDNIVFRKRMPNATSLASTFC